MVAAGEPWPTSRRSSGVSGTNDRRRASARRRLRRPGPAASGANSRNRFFDRQLERQRRRGTAVATSLQPKIESRPRRCRAIRRCRCATCRYGRTLSSACRTRVSRSPGCSPYNSIRLATSGSAANRSIIASPVGPACPQELQHPIQAGAVDFHQQFDQFDGSISQHRIGAATESLDQLFDPRIRCWNSDSFGMIMGPIK